jgi:hypothetical protein
MQKKVCLETILVGLAPDEKKKRHQSDFFLYFALSKSNQIAIFNLQDFSIF